jgi:micrococcal nuclease
MVASMKRGVIAAAIALSVHLGGVCGARAEEAQGSWSVVTAVLDGDTIRIGTTSVRLIGVDAPEIAHRAKPGEYFGPEATRFARQMLLGKRVRLTFNTGDEVDAYGRVLAYVFLEDGTFVNRELVRLGYARALTRFPFAYADDFRGAQDEARRAGRGLWAHHAASAATSAGKIIGNRYSKVYHLPGQEHYDDVGERNRIYFESEAQAQQMGYRRAKR